jgi:UDP-N-acetylglucosamine 1-carboxyvinyltransferase
MSKVKIIGGQPLHGTVRISGAKNSTLPLLAATILLNGRIELNNTPCLTDITTMIRMLKSLGLTAEQHKQKVRIVNRGQVRHLVPYELMTKMRASFFVAGPILARTGMVRIPLPGGCAIGARPVDIHLAGFKSLGAEVKLEHGFMEIKAKKLKGGEVNFSFPSVGATENIIMAAVLAEGDTEIKNAACEPEIVDLANLLNKAGALIEGAGTPTISVKGVTSLKGVEHDVISDRIEAGTMILAGLLTKSPLTIEGVIPEHLGAFLDKLKLSGARFNIEGKTVKLERTDSWQGIDISTSPYPGFPTDMQAQMMTYLALAKGTSVIEEHIFENRFMHTAELMRMGAYIKVKDHIAVVTGVRKFSGAEVRCTDLRAGAALWLAGLAAEGETIIYDNEHVERGYDDLQGKLTALGAKNTRFLR